MLIQLPSTVQGLKPDARTTVRRWLRKVGEGVAAGQPLVELETDDAIFHLQAPADGTVGEIHVMAGKTVSPGTTLGVFNLGIGSKQTTQPRASAAELPALPFRDGGTGTTGVVPVLMPQAGNTMEEGTIIKWRVKEGDVIAVGQVICEIETDKATVEMEATDAGRVAKIVAQAGAVVPVKQAMAYLAENADMVEAYLAGGGASAVASGAPANMPSAATAAQGMAPEGAVQASVTTAPGLSHGATGRVKASPAARKMAAGRGIDLATVGVGSGPGGRILSTDVVGAKARGPAASMPSAGGRRAMSKMRKAIATNLQTSKQTVPHFYVRLTINADPLMAFYKAQKPATGCTLNDVILLAVGRLVGEFAAFRTRVDGGDLVESAAANIGVAVSVNDGLVVPVVMNVQAMTLGQLAPEARRVVEAARGGKIENMGKGVFTISNMGMLGVEEFAAIINPPESGILAIAGVREAVIVKDGAMRAGRVMTLTLSVDHRVVDGALAAGFMGRMKELLEMPEKMLTT